MPTRKPWQVIGLLVTYDFFFFCFMYITSRIDSFKKVLLSQNNNLPSKTLTEQNERYENKQFVLKQV